MGWTEADVQDHLKRLREPSLRAKDHVRPDGHVVVPRGPQIQRMNKWEESYAQHLNQCLLAKTVLWFGFEAVKLRLACATWYTPDFAVLTLTGLEIHEIKGHWRDDALVKFKVAAEQFPFPFYAIRKRKVSEGGGWETIRFIDGRLTL